MPYERAAVKNPYRNNALWTDYRLDLLIQLLLLVLIQREKTERKCQSVRRCLSFHE